MACTRVKFFGAFLSVLLIFLASLAIPFASWAWDGTTKTEPPLVGEWYEISTAEQLAWVADKVNTENNAYKDKKYRLAADIDLSNMEWTPIGNGSSITFTGTFDGGGHVVSNMKIQSSATVTHLYVGLFGNVETGGNIANVGVANFDIEVTNNAPSPYNNAGGLAGRNQGTIAASYATGSVTANGSGTNSVGGLVGLNEQGTIAACYAAGSATAKNGAVTNSDYAGGLVGNNNNEATITSSYATGSATANGRGANAGGLAGYNFGTIAASYATGDAAANGTGTYARAGGLVGWNREGKTITDSYATGSATANGTGASAGGLVGTNDSGGTITRCYSRESDTNVTAQVSDFSDKNNFSNFSFTNDWCFTGIDPSRPYPRAFFDTNNPDASDNLNALSPDLVQIRPVEFSIKPGKTETAHISAFGWTPDAAMSFDPAVSEVTVSRGTSPNEIVVGAGMFKENATVEPSLIFTINGSRQTPKKIKLTLTDAIAEEDDLSGRVAKFYVRNVPLTPIGVGASADLYVQWESADGRGVAPADPLTADNPPNPMPSVEWSVNSPEGGGGYEVVVSPDATNPLKARLHVVSGEAQSLAWEEYGVTVRMTQEGNDALGEMAYTRDFLVGMPFPTAVTLSPEAAAEIDRVNALLARTDVKIQPGNHQKPIPDHILSKIVYHLENDLIDPTQTDAARGTEAYPISMPPEGWVPRSSQNERGEQRTASGDQGIELFVLASLDVIDELRVESPDVPSVPSCFDCTEKESANIVLDLTKLTALSDEVVMIPMSYTVKILSGDLTEFFGAPLAAEIVSNPAGNLDNIFEVLVLHKRIKDADSDMYGWYTRLVRGVSSPQDAYDTGMLKVWSNVDEQSLTVNLGYYVIDYHGESFTVSDFEIESDESSETIGYIVLPDGKNNRLLIDPLWTNIWKADASDGGGGGGGGGCATGAATLALLAAFAMVARRRRKK